MKGRGEIPIIICCAEEDEPALAKVVDELRREGLAPELVPGVEVDGELLVHAVDSASPEALFVLCTSSSLDKNVARRLTGLFSARSGPRQRIVSTSFTPSRPLAVLPAIRGALRDLRTADDRAESESPPTFFRDVVEALADPADAPRGAGRRASREVDARAEPPARAESRREITRSDGSRGEASRGEASRDQASARDRGASRDARAQAVETRAPSPVIDEAPRPIPTTNGPVVHRPVIEPPVTRAANVAPPSSTSIAASPSESTQAAVQSLEARLSSVPQMPDTMVRSDPDTAAYRSVRGSGPPVRIANDDAPSSIMSHEPPRGNRMLLLFAGVGIAGIATLAGMQLLQPEPRANPAAAVGGQPETTPRDSKDTPTPPVAADAKTPPVVADEKAPPVIAEGKTPPVVDDAKAPPVTPPVEPPMPDSDTAEPEDGNTSDRPEVPPSPASMSRRDVDRSALELALNERRIDRVGTLWFTRASDADVSWEDAQRKCQGKRINGVNGFRLPGAREINKLRSSGAITSGSYWTRDKQGAGDEATAIDASSGAKAVYLTIEASARALCVRVL